MILGRSQTLLKWIDNLGHTEWVVGHNFEVTNNGVQV